MLLRARTDGERHVIVESRGSHSFRETGARPLFRESIPVGRFDPTYTDRMEASVNHLTLNHRVAGSEPLPAAIDSI
jgi:hypothetical protein